MPALSCNCLQKKHEVGLFDGGVKNNSHPERRMKGGVEGRTEGVAIKCCSLLCAQCVAGGGKDWKRLASHTKNVFFPLPSFPQGKRTLGRMTKRLCTCALVCHDILPDFVSSYRPAPAQYLTISILNYHAYSAAITPAII